MKNLKLKWILTIAVILVTLFSLPSIILATNEEVQILRKSSSEYMLYLEGHMDTKFEFAFSNEKNATKESLTYKESGLDSLEADANHIAYVDDTLYTTYFSKTTYLWARTLTGEYLVNGIEINLQEALTDENIEFVNQITKMIKVDTKNTLTTQEEVDDVKITKTVGKIDVLEEGNTFYQFVRLPSSEEHKQFMEIAEKIADGKIGEDMYSKLDAVNKFITLHQKLSPAADSDDWKLVTDNTILQPEDSKNGEQYIVWLKNEKASGETKIDVQFLTCFEDYKTESINEKVVTRLPVTYDNPILFIILAALVVAFVVVLILKRATTKKESN